eukprot:TRINITY_DN39811_c0_g2_i3.p2 TRINITY_DN39811_c0_g2~~TRINITY_DN39811_c0_g2_i3.p2  ORF type:complete len:156 (-),score=56.91 TRINITY_DN39811_c0_g2_i3:309-776(-)
MGNNLRAQLLLSYACLVRAAPREDAFPSMTQQETQRRGRQRPRRPRKKGGGDDDEEDDDEEDQEEAVAEGDLEDEDDEFFFDPSPEETDDEDYKSETDDGEFYSWWIPSEISAELHFSEPQRIKKPKWTNGMGRGPRKGLSNKKFDRRRIAYLKK